jgi:hypothetical protein
MGFLNETMTSMGWMALNVVLPLIPAVILFAMLPKNQAAC